MPQHIKITTAQNVNIEYRLAGIGDRILARLLDGLIKGAYGFMLFIIMSTTDMMWLLIGMIPVMIYSLLFEIFNNGQTPGKSIMKIQVISADGAPTRISQYITRWLLLIVDETLLYGLVGLIAIAVSQKHQRLGDLAANTIVISLKAKNENQRGAYIKVDPNYIPTYPEAAKLTSKDVAIIKKVLTDRSDNKHQYHNQAKSKMEEQLGIYAGSNSSRTFLNTLIKDYNYYMQQDSSPTEETDLYG